MEQTNSGLEQSAKLPVEINNKDIFASMETTDFFDNLSKEDFTPKDLDMTFHSEMRDYAILANQQIGFERYLS